MKYPTKTDILVILSLLLTCLFFILKPLNQDGKKTLYLISKNGKHKVKFENKKIDLSKKYGKNIILEIKDGKARFLKSDCPNKLCIKYGWVENCGEMSACVPNKIAIQIRCDKEEEVDAISK